MLLNLREERRFLPSPEGRGSRAEDRWIPEAGAKLKKRLHFDDDTSEVWTVVAVFGRQQESFLREHAMAYRHQREMSDI